MLFQFLNGLDEIYAPQRSHLLMMSPLPSTDEACNTIQQEETQRSALRPVKDEDGLVMLTKSGAPICGACGKTGHLKKDCWTIVGYPSWYDQNLKDKWKGKEKEGTSYPGGRGGRHHRGGRASRTGGRTGGSKFAAHVGAMENHGDLPEITP